MKTSQFNKLAFSVKQNSPGFYSVFCIYKGQKIEFTSHQSLAYDRLDDESDRKARAAAKVFYNEIVKKYNQLKGIL